MDLSGNFVINLSVKLDRRDLWDFDRSVGDTTYQPLRSVIAVGNSSVGYLYESQAGNAGNITGTDWMVNSVWESDW